MKKFTSGSLPIYVLVLFLSAFFLFGCSSTTTRKVLNVAIDGATGASQEDQQKSLNEAFQAGGEEASQSVKEWSVAFEKSLTEVGDRKAAINTAVITGASEKPIADKLPAAEFIEAWGNDAHRVLEGPSDPAKYSMWWRVDLSPDGLFNQNHEPVCEGWVTLGDQVVYRFFYFSKNCSQKDILARMLKNRTLSSLTPEEHAKVVWILATVVARETKGIPPPSLDALLKLAK